MTYGGLSRAVAVTRGRLHANGVGKGQSVAILMPQGTELALAFLSVASTCTAAPLNPTASASDITHWLEDLVPAAVMVSEGTSSMHLAAIAAMDIPIIRFDAKETVREDILFDLLGVMPGPDDVALVLHTSGTTAKPKMVPLTHANLLCSAKNVSDSLRLSIDDRCVVVMPLFHIHGIVACLLAPLFSGGSVIIPDGFDGDRFMRVLRRGTASWYSAVPAIHHRILSYVDAHPGSCEGHRLRLIRSSSAALPESVSERLRSRFGVPVIEAYGMTEAAHQMCSNPLPPAVQKPGSVGPAAGPEVDIVNDAGIQLPYGAIGEVVIRGVNVTAGYLYLPLEKQGRLPGGWFRTGDMGYLDPHGYLYLTGRIKEIVNRGGEKVSPKEVDEALLQHPAVSEAVCFGIAHPTLGEDLAAAVVCHSASTADEAELRHFLMERISHFKVPSRILLLDEIPKSSIGKVQRLKMSSLLAVQLEPTFTAPATDAERIVADVFAAVLDSPKAVGRTDNFFSLGGDSLQAANAAVILQERFNTEVPATLLFRYPTPESIGAHLARVREKLSSDLNALMQDMTPEEIDNLLKNI